MSRRSLRCTAAVLLFASLLAVPASFAAGRPRPAKLRAAQVSQSAALELFSRAWSFFTSVWTKEGCHIDPDGRCIASPAPQPDSTDQTEIGCHIDPNGGTRCGS